MLNLRQVKHLARTLETSVDGLHEGLVGAEGCYETLILRDPAKPNKPREVVSVRGMVRQLQSKLYRRVLLPKLAPSAFSHGGVRGRHIKTNAGAHRQSAFIYKTDIAAFYPTIHRSRVYRLFVGKFHCSPDVARLCTRLCTYRHQLALGLLTSPILADQVLHRVDARIGAACSRAGLVYTRYVDDVTISGSFDLEQSGFADIVADILADDGFQTNPKKHQFSALSKHVSITNIRVVGARFDVRKDYADELERQLNDARRLATGERFDGPYYTATQIRGRVQFVGWVNPRLAGLMKLYRSIPWRRTTERARELGLVEAKKTLEKVRQSQKTADV